MGWFQSYCDLADELDICSTLCECSSHKCSKICTNIANCCETTGDYLETCVSDDITSHQCCDDLSDGFINCIENICYYTICMSDLCCVIWCCPCIVCCGNYYLDHCVKRPVRSRNRNNSNSDSDSDSNSDSDSDSDESSESNESEQERSDIPPQYIEGSLPNYIDVLSDTTPLIISTGRKKKRCNSI